MVWLHLFSSFTFSFYVVELQIRLWEHFSSETFIVFKEGKKMWESNHQKRRSAHSDGTPDRWDIDIPREKDSSYDGHDDDIVSEGPEKIQFDEQISSFYEPNHGQYFVYIFWENNNICSIDVELWFSVNTDSYSCFLKTRNIVESISNHNSKSFVIVLNFFYPFHFVEGTLLWMLAIKRNSQVCS